MVREHASSGAAAPGPDRSAHILSFLPGMTPRRLHAWKLASLTCAAILDRKGDGLWDGAAIRRARESAERERELAETAGIAVVGIEDPDYPPLLARIPDAPPALRILARPREEGGRAGLPPDQGRAPVAIVGSRHADAYGRGMAEQFAKGIAGQGHAVVSGLAYGVDAVAHRAALAQPGRTIAVLGSGVDVVYPREHIGLARDLVDHGGALVSELPCGTRPDRGHFPRRNRILAALSLGTLVIQAGARSGTFITARLSLDYDRLVWAVPGRIGDALSAGALALLRQGAIPATCPEDVLSDIAPLADPRGLVPSPMSPPRIPSSLPPLLQAVGPGGATIEELVLRTGDERAHVATQLLKYELAGTVAVEQGGIYRLTGKARPGLD